MKYIVCIFVLQFLLFGCVKDGQSTIEGRYIGDRIEAYESYSEHYGYQKGDTTYLDTVDVKFIGADSISFTNGIEVKFKLNDDNIYSDFYAIGNGFEYIVTNDSLLYRASSYGGPGGTYISSKTNFAGIKRN